MGITRMHKVSRNGQVSIPAIVRSRWNTDRVVTVDMGDYVLIRPMPADPVGSVIGKYASPALDTDRLRVDERSADLRREKRKRQ